MRVLIAARQRFSVSALHNYSQCRHMTVSATKNHKVMHASPAPKLGFVGLGNMGERMAANLIRKQFHPIVYDVSSEAIDRLRQRVGGTEETKLHQRETGMELFTVATSLASLGRQADIIISMLPTSQHVWDAHFGAEGTLTELESGHADNRKRLLVDSSTIDPLMANKIHETCEALGFPFVDAPVTGAMPAAETGSLCFLCGGHEAAVTRVTPILLAMGRRVIHCGGSGLGQIAKLCNNSVLGATMVATVEAMKLGETCGLNPLLLADILNSGSARSWVTEVWNPVPDFVPQAPAARNYAPGFKADLLLKDLKLVTSVAESVGAKLPIANVALKVYEELTKQNKGGLDFSCIYKHWDLTHYVR